MRILFNPQEFTAEIERPDGSKYLQTSPSADVVNYPIAQALKDSAGNIIMDEAMGTYRTTGQTLEFTLLKGQAGEFEDYVAEILLDRYGFLSDKTDKVGKTVKAAIQPEENIAKVAGEFKCQYCGQTFNKAVHLGMHLGGKHPEQLGG